MKHKPNNLVYFECIDRLCRYQEKNLLCSSTTIAFSDIKPLVCTYGSLAQYDSVFKDKFTHEEKSPLKNFILSWHRFSNGHFLRISYNDRIKWSSGLIVSATPKIFFKTL